MGSETIEGELKRHLKIKCENSTKVEEKTIMLICHCGQTINGRHSCLKEKEEPVKKLQVIECGFSVLGNKISNTCSFCEEDAKKKQFVNQWRIDGDGYCRCTECDDKCDDELPKDCSCTWYFDREGVARCK